MLSNEDYLFFKREIKENLKTESKSYQNPKMDRNPKIDQNPKMNQNPKMDKNPKMD